MKAKLVVASAKSEEIRKLMGTAASAGSDNGLSPNYLSVITPIIDKRTITGRQTTYGVFITLLFNPDNLEFVKTGTISIAATQRTANLCESEELPEGCTIEMIRKMPTVEIISGSSRMNGKSAYETVKGWWDAKQVIQKLEQKRVVNLAFDANGQPTMEGTRTRERWTFEPVTNEEIYKKVGEVLKELYDASQDENLKTHFEAAGIDFPIAR